MLQTAIPGQRQVDLAFFVYRHIEDLLTVGRAGDLVPFPVQGKLNVIDLTIHDGFQIFPGPFAQRELVCTAGFAVCTCIHG